MIWPVLAKGSHSFTCHPLTVHTCLYSPVAKHHRPLSVTHCAYPRLNWSGWLVLFNTEIDFLHQELKPRPVIHPSTNQAQRWVTLLIEANALPLSQTAIVHVLSFVQFSESGSNFSILHGSLTSQSIWKKLHRVHKGSHMRNLHDMEQKQ